MVIRMAFIELDGVHKEFTTGVTVVALQDIEFSVKAGEFVAIMGPSGSGKSTMLNIVGGLDRPDRGRVKVDDMDIYDLPGTKVADYRREYVGFIFQQFHLVPTLTAAENVAVPLMLAGLSSTEQTVRAERALTWVGLKDKGDRLPNQLSGGEQQRVAIARATVNEPAIVLADEPTGNLDSATGTEIMDILSELNERGTTVLLVTHDKQLAEMADRIITIKDGVSHE